MSTPLNDQWQLDRAQPGQLPMRSAAQEKAAAAAAWAASGQPERRKQPRLAGAGARGIRRHRWIDRDT
ncbi:MAG TPA: hypothetical protein VK800_02240 [Steroidobacteraceae bacterium]|jgi:hypothetical protein|nr:hypothetical protein [Steroidobacteraceae bacterium]